MKKPDKKNKLQKTKSKIKPSPKGGITKERLKEILDTDCGRYKNTLFTFKG